MIYISYCITVHYYVMKNNEIHLNDNTINDMIYFYEEYMYIYNYVYIQRIHLYIILRNV